MKCDCGFLYRETEEQYCFVSKKLVDDKCNTECKNYIMAVYDGDQVFSPEEHLYFLNDSVARKGMKTNIRGMKF